MGATPVRDAATIMLVREAGGGAGVEVLMLRRNLQAVFAGGAYVFPGGAVDPGDVGPDLIERCDGPTPEEADRRLGVESGGLAFYIAAVRECFEEAGVLLATRAGGEPLALEGDEGRRFAAHRHELNAGGRSFADLCEAESLLLSLDRVEYFSHWITPVGAPRRFDTRFFVAAAPERQVAVHDDGETIASLWISPARALANHEDGTFDLLLPTLENLEALERFESAAELLEAARRARDVPAMLPRVRVEAGGVRIFLPGDPGYDEASQEAGLLEGMPLPGRVGGPVRGSRTDR
jgi:8-oxo-dGTP pyrophosphatase MutT (NUDIX family)